MIKKLTSCWRNLSPSVHYKGSSSSEESAVSILKKSEYANAILQIKQLISVSSHAYVECYLPLILKLANAAQFLPAYETGNYQKEGGFLANALQRTIHALKKRQGFLLPPGGTVEEQYREQDIWTYAIYIASLLQDCDILATGFLLYDSYKNRIHLPWQLPIPGAVYSFQKCELPDLTERLTWRLLILGQWLPTASLQWLSQFPRVKADWLKAVTNQAGSCVISTILVGNQKNSGNVLAETMATTVNQFCDENIATEPIHHSSSEAAQPVSDTTAVKPSFLQWLCNKLANSYDSINTIDSGIFHLEEGCLVVYPLLHQFIEESGNSWNIDELLLQLERQELLEKKGLQRYCVGNWQTRTTVEGLLLKNTLAFDSDPLPPVYDQAYLDA